MIWSSTQFTWWDRQISTQLRIRDWEQWQSIHRHMNFCLSWKASTLCEIKCLTITNYNNMTDNIIKQEQNQWHILCLSILRVTICKYMNETIEPKCVCVWYDSRCFYMNGMAFCVQENEFTRNLIRIKWVNAASM